MHESETLHNPPRQWATESKYYHVPHLSVADRKADTNAQGKKVHHCASKKNFTGANRDSQTTGSQAWLPVPARRDGLQERKMNRKAGKGSKI